jgi:formiminotetrahydrofolate cyclodeaminase
LNTLQYANRAKNIQNKSKKNETNPAKVVAELREQIELLKAQLNNGNSTDPEQVKMLQNTIGSLEYAKRQTWEEKVNMSKKFNENRWVFTL